MNENRDYRNLSALAWVALIGAIIAIILSAAALNRAANVSERVSAAGYTQTTGQQTTGQEQVGQQQTGQETTGGTTGTEEQVGNEQQTGGAGSRGGVGGAGGGQTMSDIRDRLNNLKPDIQNQRNTDNVTKEISDIRQNISRNMQNADENTKREMQSVDQQLQTLEQQVKQKSSGAVQTLDRIINRLDQSSSGNTGGAGQENTGSQQFRD